MKKNKVIGSLLPDHGIGVFMVYGEFYYGHAPKNGTLNHFYVIYPTNNKVLKDWRGNPYDDNTPIKGLTFPKIYKSIKKHPLLAKKKRYDEKLRYRNMHPYFNVEAIDIEDARNLMEHDLANEVMLERRIWLTINPDGTWQELIGNTNQAQEVSEGV